MNLRFEENEITFNFTVNASSNKLPLRTNNNNKAILLKLVCCFYNGTIACFVLSLMTSPTSCKPFTGRYSRWQQMSGSLLAAQSCSGVIFYGPVPYRAMVSSDLDKTTHVHRFFDFHFSHVTSFGTHGPTNIRFVGR